jgi:hypothetical protein
VSDKIKVYKLNEYEWVASRSMDEAKKFYLKLTGLDAEDAFMDEKKVSAKEMKCLIYKDGDKERSFREQLARMVNRHMNFPCMFAIAEG